MVASYPPTLQDKVHWAESQYTYPPEGIVCFFAHLKMVLMKPLKDGDYLLEIKIRLAVRNEDATAVIAMGPKWAKDRTEETKLTSAIFSLIEKGLAKHSDLIQVAHLNSRRVPSVAEFHDFVNETFPEFKKLDRAAACA